MMRHGIRGTTVMSSGQACELLAHQDQTSCFYGFSHKMAFLQFFSLFEQKEVAIKKVYNIDQEASRQSMRISDVQLGHGLKYEILKQTNSKHEFGLFFLFVSTKVDCLHCQYLASIELGNGGHCFGTRPRSNSR